MVSGGVCVATNRKLDRHSARRSKPMQSIECRICHSSFSTTDGRRKRCDNCTGDHAAWARNYRAGNAANPVAVSELTCSKCKLTKPVSEFFRNRGTKTGYHYRCKGCFHPPAERLAKARKWSYYRLRPEDIEALLAHQNGGCALCGTELDPKTMHIDHDHECDHPDKGYYSCKDCVRGLLCPGCNVFLGYLEPRLHLMPVVVEYLKGLSWSAVLRIPNG